MSKKLKALLENLKVENVEETYNALMDDETDNEEILDSILKGAQSYARPFIESELSTSFNEERKSHKGKYMKEAVLLANKEFGSVLTNSEIEKVMSDPANKDKTINAVFKALKDKAMSKEGSEPNEIRNMLELANQKISELEQERDGLSTKYETDYNNKLKSYKLDSLLLPAIAKHLEGKTVNKEEKAAALLAPILKEMAELEASENNSINVFSKQDGKSPLKMTDTKAHTFGTLVDYLAEDNDLIQKSNGGAKFVNGQKVEPEPKKEYTGLAAKMAAITD